MLWGGEIGRVLCECATDFLPKLFVLYLLAMRYPLPHCTRMGKRFVILRTRKSIVGVFRTLTGYYEQYEKKRSTRATIHGQRFLWMFKALSEGMLSTPFSALVHALLLEEAWLYCLILCSKCKYFKLECQVPSAHALTMRGIACGRKVCVS